MLDSRICVKRYMSLMESSTNAAYFKDILEFTIHTPIISTHVDSPMRR